MLAPIYASQIAMMMFFKNKAYKHEAGLKSFKIFTLGYIMVTPLMIVFMIFMDIVFMFMQAFLYPFVQLIKLLTCFKYEFTWLSDLMDWVYSVFFDMDKVDVEGFRRSRIISQLTFETVIQTLLQARMLLYFSKPENQSDQNAGKLDVSPDSLATSLGFSLMHLVMEVFLLIMEARATKTEPLNYAFVCFNGKFGFVPYNDHL